MNIQTSLISFVNDGILAGKTSATMKNYQYSLKSFNDYIKSRFLPQEVETITSQLISEFFIYGIKVRKWSKYTHFTMYKNFNAYLNWGVRKGNFTQNPIVGIPKPKLLQQPPKSFSELEILKLLRIVANMQFAFTFPKLRNKAVVCLFIFTGLRKSELLNLKCEDIDLHNGYLIVQNGKGGKRREIPLEQETLLPLLREYADYREKLCKTSPWFFTGTFSGRGHNYEQLAMSTIDRFFSKVSKICKFSKSVSAHKLRHSFATLFLDKGGDIYTLKELMGHSDILTTCIYLSSTRRKKVEEINKLKLTVY